MSYRYHVSQNDVIRSTLFLCGILSQNPLPWSKHKKKHKLRMGGHSPGYLATIPQDCQSYQKQRQNVRPLGTEEIWQLSAMCCLGWILEQNDGKEGEIQIKSEL